MSRMRAFARPIVCDSEKMRASQPKTIGLEGLREPVQARHACWAASSEAFRSATRVLTIS